MRFFIMWLVHLLAKNCIWRADPFDVEEFFVVVSADQAENIFDFIFHFCGLDRPNIGMIRLNKLSHSTRYRLPENDAGEADTV